MALPRLASAKESAMVVGQHTDFSVRNFFGGAYAREAMEVVVRSGRSEEEARRIIMGVTASFRDYDDEFEIPHELMCAVLGIDLEGEEQFFDEKKVGRGFAAFLAHSRETLTASNYNFMRGYLIRNYCLQEERDPYFVDILMQDVIRRFHRKDPFRGEGLLLRQKFWKYYGCGSVPEEGFPFLSGASHIRSGAFAAIKSIGAPDAQAIDLANRICLLISVNDGHHLNSALSESLEWCPYVPGNLDAMSKVRRAFWSKLRMRTNRYGHPHEW